MAYSDKQKEEIFAEVCKQIAKGAALRTVLKSTDLPSTDVFYSWMDLKQGDSDEVKEYKSDKSKQYARACEERGHVMFEDVIDIADDSSDDVIKIEEDGITIERPNKENVQRSRLRVDARKWYLSKLNPKKYGERQQIDVNDITDEQRKRAAALFPTEEEWAEQK